MLGFEIQQANEAIYSSLNEYRKRAKRDIEKELNSEGYKKIFTNVSVTLVDNGIDYKFNKTEELIKTEEENKKNKIKEQNIPFTLAHGGAIKVGDEFIYFKPSSTVRKYLGLD